MAHYQENNYLMEIDDKIQQEPITSGHDMEADSLELGARNNFIKKVYTILGIQLSVTVGFVLLSMFNTAFVTFQVQNQWLVWVSVAISFISLIVLACVPGVTTKSPINAILMIIFTLAESYIVSFICSKYTSESVINAAVATLGATIGLTAYAIKTKSDFSDSYSKCAGKLVVI